MPNATEGKKPEAEKVGVPRASDDKAHPVSGKNSGATERKGKGHKGDKGPSGKH